MQHIRMWTSFDENSIEILKEIQMSGPSTWDATKMRLPIGSLIQCIVTRHEPFGVFALLPGVPFDGLIQIVDFKDKDEGRMTMKDFPPIGTQLNVVVLGFQESTREIWLGAKPSQIASSNPTEVKFGNEITIPVGLRMRADGKFEFFGVSAVNALVPNTMKVLRIEQGDAFFIKSEGPDDDVRLRISGFSLRVVVERSSGGQQAGDTAPY